MITMDLQGITWAGNLYQKFEAMCLEVEENMYQDTVRFVEDQVQMVGASVKKFYSDVMQDLSPSSIDPVKVAGSDLPLEQRADIGIYKKPKAAVKEEAIKADIEQSTKDSNAIADVVKDVDNTLSFTSVCDVNYPSSSSSGESVEGECSDLNLGKHYYGGMHKQSNVGINESLINEKPPLLETPGVVTHLPKDLSTASSFCELVYKNHEVAADQIEVVSPPDSVEVKEGDSEEGKICSEIDGATECTADVSIDCLSADEICLVESVGKKQMEMGLLFSGGLSAESSAAGTPINDELISMNGFTSYAESAEEVSISHPGRPEDWNSIKGNGVIEPRMDSVEPLDKVNLDEICVMVDADKSCFVSQREGKRRSYKKKIRDAFSSKMKSARKQEYEQLAVWCGEVNAGSNQQSAESSMPTLTMESDGQKFLAHDFCESEWELL